jgi:DNA-directed RNA polymerase specialized sigma24 family protein
VRKTAAMIDEDVEDEFEEICQFLREKVWKALEAFTADRVITTSKLSPEKQIERFVFACVTNGKKDLLKKKRRNWLYIEDFKHSGHNEYNFAFENRYLRIEDVYAEIESELPALPPTLTDHERAVTVLLYLSFSTDEIATQVGGDRKAVNATVRSIKLKLADWAPRGLVVVPDAADVVIGAVA